jgi:hypothetical protein
MELAIQAAPWFVQTTLPWGLEWIIGIEIVQCVITSRHRVTGSQRGLSGAAVAETFADAIRGTTTRRSQSGAGVPRRSSSLQT